MYGEMTPRTPLALCCALALSGCTRSDLAIHSDATNNDGETPPQQIDQARDPPPIEDPPPCVGESETVLCQRGAVACGALSVTDACGVTRVIASCGGCLRADSCVAGACIDCDGAALAPFAGGNGDAAAPYRVCTETQLLALLADPSTWNSYIQLDRDLRLDPAAPWTPIGDETTPFRGVFDGGGHRIKDLTVPADLTTVAGFFGVLDSAVVRSLAFTDVHLDTAASKVGVVAGSAYGSLIDRVTVEGLGGIDDDIITTGSAGGLIGEAVECMILDSSTDVRIQAANAGGIAASLLNSVVARSHTAGDVTAIDKAGGLIAYCWSESQQWEYSPFVSMPAISESFATGAVTGASWVGGLVGAQNGFCRVWNSYASGAVAGATSVGGFTGIKYSQGGAYRSYARGPVQGTIETGGFAGSLGGASNVVDTYWSSEASPGVPDVGSGGPVAGLHDLTLNGLRDPALLVGFVWGAPWVIDGVADGYPSFVWNADPCVGKDGALTYDAYGAGTATAPYQLCTATQLRSIGAAPSSWSSTFAVMRPIDLGGAEWNIIGNATTPFTGRFHGNGFALRNLTISGGDTLVGMFGKVAGGAILTDVVLEDARVTATGPQVGTLVGNVDGGFVVGCRSDSVAGALVNVPGDGASSVGGLIGDVGGGSEIYQSFANVEVEAGTNCASVGGLTGQSLAVIHGVGALGTVRCASGTAVGGIAGVLGGGTLSSAFALGDVQVLSAGQRVGGIVGHASNCPISHILAAGAVTGAVGVGGVVGQQDDSTTTSAISVGLPVGTSAVGGIVGTLGGTANVSLAYWRVPATSPGLADSGAGDLAGASALTDADMRVSTNLSGVVGVKPQLWRLRDGYLPEQRAQYTWRLLLPRVNN